MCSVVQTSSSFVVNFDVVVVVYKISEYTIQLDHFISKNFTMETFVCNQLLFAFANDVMVSLYRSKSLFLHSWRRVCFSVDPYLIYAQVSRHYSAEFVLFVYTFRKYLQRKKKKYRFSLSTKEKEKLTQPIFIQAFLFRLDSNALHRCDFIVKPSEIARNSIRWLPIFLFDKP